MSASLGELFVQLVFDGDTKKAEEFKKKLLETSKATDTSEKKSKKATKTLLKYTATITGAIFAVKKMTDSLIHQNQLWLNLTRTSDLALTSLQKWNAIGKMYGISNASEQIKSLNDRLFELKLTGANASGFMLAGINPTNTEDVLEQLRERIKGLNDTSASYLLQQIGLDANMLHLLRLSRQEFESLNKEVSKYQLTSKQRKDIQYMNVQLQISAQKIQYLKDRAILAILPYWTRLIKGITNFTVKIAEAIKNISKLHPKMLETVADISKIIAIVGVLTVALKGIKIVIDLISKAIFLLIKDPKILAITAGLMAVGLILEDILTFFEGGESYTGDFLNFLKNINSELVKTVFSLDKIKDFYTTMGKLASLFNPFEQTAQAVFNAREQASTGINQSTNNNNKNISIIQNNSFETNVPVEKVKNGLADSLIYANRQASIGFA